MNEIDRLVAASYVGALKRDLEVREHYGASPEALVGDLHDESADVDELYNERARCTPGSAR